MNWFARIVAHHPYVILVAVAVFAGTCLIIPLTTKKPPDFSDPQLGFEARGTVLAQRLTAWKNLLDATGPSGPLVIDPRQIPTHIEIPRYNVSQNAISKAYETKEKGTVLAHKMTTWENQLPKVMQPVGSEVNSIPGFTRSTPSWMFSNTSEVLQDVKNNSDSDGDALKELEGFEKSGMDIVDHHHDHQHLSSDGFFCASPSIDYSRVVLQATDGRDLFTLESILSMCHIEAQLMTNEQFHSICESISHGRCCHSWSLGNYIALLHNRTSCFAVTSEDVSATKSLLKMCAFYYHNLKLTPDCQENDYWFCQQVPQQCSQHNAVYYILYYLVDINFLPPNESSSNNSLVNSMLILPIACSSATLEYYHTLDIRSLRHGNVEVVAIEFGLKSTLFNECLVRDTWMIGAGGTFVLVCMWLYTGSLFVTIMTVIAIAFSLGISYFMYTLVFELRFFPFMNLLASIVAVGIGADDAFIFCKVWQCAKAEKNNGTLVKLVHDTLRHATLSMFVTSLTTAAAFYASYISSITAIGCFSVFAGTATLANFALMVTWLPAAVVVSERWCCPPMVPPQWFAWDSRLRPVRVAVDQARALLDRFLVLAVIKLRYMWLAVLGGAAIASVGIVFYYPRLKLPDSRDFQLFDSHHPFERYDLVYRDKFWFERLQKIDSEDGLNSKLPLRFVWGVMPIDNGDYLDPGTRGTLIYDETFDMAAPESQRWLLGFCQRLRMQSFFQPMLGPLLPNCFITSFKSWMQRRCRDPVDRIDRTPCCENSTFPYKRRVFEMCIVQAIVDLYETPIEYLIPGMAGLKFSRDKHPKIRALVVEYDSNQSYSLSFSDMDAFFHQVESWARKELSEAPPGMRNGWFVSQLDFYDLQRTLSQDTLVAIGVSMGIALVVLLLVTLNILLSLYAILTITCTIFVTVALLVLLGWKLNVLESIAVSVAIGLAVDFSLHYGVHYRMCPDGDDRESAVTYAISRMGGPTAMAALTTAAAGAFMLPSAVLAYIQIGIFLVAVMAVSWIYSTFFLGSLLRVGGPQHGFGQFSYPRLDKNCCMNGDGSSGGSSNVDRADKTVYTNVLSESTLSTSSTVCALHPSASESHELEALSAKRLSNSFSSRRLCRSGSLSATLPSSTSAPLAARVSARKVSLPADQSPSAASATTIVLVDDGDVDSRPGVGDMTEEPLMRH
ncbi:protein dispatched [Periplaneta americana]|uniref:protein dispatched n=1 Tax=Periplaneta americana TaxID=6978 RepID=UPI0037E760DB